MKCVVVGTSAVGKTCLILVFQDNSWISDSQPTVLDEIDVQVVVGKNVVEKISIWDTAGSEEYDEVRPSVYKQSDIFLICFGIDSRDSFNAVWDKWYGEVRRRVVAPIFLIGTKSDLRNSSYSSQCISITEAVDLAKRIGACAYAECSAKSVSNISGILKQIVKYGKPSAKKRISTFQRVKKFLHIPDATPASTTGGVDFVEDDAYPRVPVFNNDETPLSEIEQFDYKIITKILSFLSPSGLALCCEVSKNFNTFANNPELWEVHCRAIDPSYSFTQSAEAKLVYQVLTGGWINDFSTDAEPPEGLEISSEY